MVRPNASSTYAVLGGWTATTSFEAAAGTTLKEPVVAEVRPVAVATSV